MLYALSIPWYRSAGPASGTFLGLPDWVATALLCYALAAVLNACAWLLTDVSDSTPADAGSAAPRGDAVERPEAP